MKYCQECGKELVEVLVPSIAFSGETARIKRCPDAKGSDAFRHHYEVIGYTSKSGKFDAYTGERNGP